MAVVPVLVIFATGLVVTVSVVDAFFVVAEVEIEKSVSVARSHIFDA